jgi:hypothetical protein
MVAGNIIGGGTRRFWLISLTLFQFVLYCVLIVVGDVQVKAYDEYIEDLAKHGVAFDGGSSRPRCHELAFGLNFPIIPVAALAGGAVTVLVRGDVRSFLDLHRSVGLQILLGSLVPPFWCAIVRAAFRTKGRLDNRRNATFVRRFGVICTVIAVALSIWVWRYNPNDQWVGQDFVVCWVIFGIFVGTANRVG